MDPDKQGADAVVDIEIPSEINLVEHNATVADNDTSLTGTWRFVGLTGKLMGKFSDATREVITGTVSGPGSSFVDVLGRDISIKAFTASLDREACVFKGRFCNFGPITVTGRFVANMSVFELGWKGSSNVRPSPDPRTPPKC